jgi:broad specificity phosphatase PhoE
VSDVETIGRWPERLWLVRHGESVGNVALQAAELAGAERIDIGPREMDVPLSELGERQARALGRWFAGQPETERPTMVLASPFMRASETARLIVETGRLKLVGPVYDERLREKEFGMLDRFTKAGIIAKHPLEAEQRNRVGKFYYRPPGGESWCDVILRLRSFVDSIQLKYRNERVLIIGHQVTVLCFRYILEELTETQILGIDRERDVANCSVTTYSAATDPSGRPTLALSGYNFVAPLEEQGTPVTNQVDPARKAD